MKKYVIVLSIVALLGAIVFIAGKDGENDLSTETPIEMTDVIATTSGIPEALSFLPPYPESPKEVMSTEYETGWKVTMTVPNAYAIAVPAWLNSLRERGMNVNDILEFTNSSEGPITWATITRGDLFMRTKIETVSDTESRITTYAKK